ncbi:hypothetical protein AYX13_03941 [Cryptococcus neoformans]|nr:hypothetical protein AYX13_03941 [Cryptococcus neoformans var. grubii]
MTVLLPEKDYLFDSIEGFEAEDYPFEGFKADGNSRPAQMLSTIASVSFISCICSMSNIVMIVLIWGMKPALQWMVVTPIKEIP